MTESHDSIGQEHPDVEQPEALHERQPRIYVASLSDYNAGYLHGEWIDAAQEPVDLQAAVSEMLSRSPNDPHAEEFAIHGYEQFGPYNVAEYDSIDWISRVARGIAEHGPAFAAWAEQCDHDEEELDRFDEAYRGEWNSLEEYAEQLLDDFGLNRDLEETIPELLQGYVHIDVAAFARDLQAGLGVTVVRDNHRVYVFEP